MSIDQAFGAQRFWDQAEQRLASGQLDAARSAYEAVLALQPGHAGARLRLVTVATTQGRYRDSIVPLLELGSAASADAELLPMLAGSLHRLGESAAARACLARPALAASSDRALLEEGARIALQLEDVPLATRLAGAAEGHGGPGAETCYLRATVALFEGRLDAAGQLLEASLAAAPRYARAHWSLARLRRQTPESNHVARLRAQLAQAGGPGERAYLGFALFKELDDLDDRDAAWAALAEGCEQKRLALAASPAARQAPDEAAAFDALQSLWAPAGTAIAPAPATIPPGTGPSTAPSPTPIFIVGLPRTGTTLLERILARTGRVTDAGELDDLPLQLRWQANRFSRSFADAGVFLAARAAADPAQLRQRYLAHAAWRAGGKRWFTDKLPLNFLNIGFIADALPDAPILHMVRNPMDTCFSNLKELFAEAYPYSYAFDTLAAHYGRYRRLMAHWHRCFPGRILDVPYEALVSDPSAWTARILAHCGIDAGGRQADAGAGDAIAVVTTASTVQVREPIHTRSVEAWRRYAAPLEPLRQRLQGDGWLPA